MKPPTLAVRKRRGALPMVRHFLPLQRLVMLAVCVAAGPALGETGDRVTAPAPQAAAADALLYARMDTASRTIAGLSRALSAAVGDAAAYARLRQEFDRQMVEYQAASDALYKASQPR